MLLTNFLTFRLSRMYPNFWSYMLNKLWVLTMGQLEDSLPPRISEYV